MRLLFVGNSYTFFNDMPGILRRLAVAAGEEAPVTEQVTAGGATLEGHWQDGTALARIQETGWDEVVLQEQSLRPVQDPPLLHEYARRFGAAIGVAGARPLFYLTWARRHLPEMQDGLDAAYDAIAAELADLGARVVPAGPAWRRALDARPELTLYLEDDSHPAPAGSYLAACVFFAVLYGRDPTELEMVDVDAGAEDPRTPVRLDEGDARLLREVAWATVTERNGDPGAVPAPEPSPQDG